MSLAAARAASPAITRLGPSFTSHLPRLDAAPSESSTEARIPSSSPPVGVQIIRRGRPSLSAARLTGDSPRSVTRRCLPSLATARVLHLPRPPVTRRWATARLRVTRRPHWHPAVTSQSPRRPPSHSPQPHTRLTRRPRACRQCNHSGSPSRRDRDRPRRRPSHSPRPGVTRRGPSPSHSLRPTVSSSSCPSSRWGGPTAKPPPKI